MDIYVSYVSYEGVSYISRATTAKASKFCVILWLELSNISPKSGVLTTNGREMP